MKASRWVILIAGIAVLAGLFLVLRPSDDAPTPNPSPSATLEPFVIKMDIVDGKVSGIPDVIRVPLGSPVQIAITSNTDGEVHLHGYEEIVEVTPGAPTSLDFVADAPGRFELAFHGDEEGELTQLQVS